MTETRRQTDDKKALKLLFCGGVAGVIAKTAIAPLDRLKIHFQVQSPTYNGYWGRLFGVFEAVHKTYLNKGVPGLYQGHLATIIRVFPYAALNYYSYEMIKEALTLRQRGSGSINDSLKRLLAGSSAGLIAVTVTYPLDLIRSRLAFQGQISGRSSLFETIRTLSKEGRQIHDCRIRGLFQGYITTLLGIIPYSGISFLTYDSLKAFSRNQIGKDIGPASTLLIGMISGAVGQTAAYPIDTIRRRAQVYYTAPHLSSRRTKMSYLLLVKDLYHTQGLRGFYVGLSVNFWKVAPASGISFIVYESLKRKLQA